MLPCRILIFQDVTPTFSFQVMQNTENTEDGKRNSSGASSEEESKDEESMTDKGDRKADMGSGSEEAETPDDTGTKTTSDDPSSSSQNVKKAGQDVDKEDE
jgi:hypothetical protein